METQQIAFCSSSSFGDTIQQDFLLLPYGTSRYTKGGETGEFEFSSADADAVIAEFTARAKDLVIDYEHQSLTGGKAPAAGWIDRLYKQAEGIFAHVKYWTDEAAEFLKKGEYRYFSPTLYFTEDGTKVAAVHSVALTNHPALHGVPALAADDSGEEGSLLNDFLALVDQEGDTAGLNMPEKRELVRKGAERLNALCDFLKKYELKDLTDAAEQFEAYSKLKTEMLVDQAFRDGKLAESERRWAEQFAANDPLAFKEWCIGAPRKIPDNLNLQSRSGVFARKGNALSAEEQKICRYLGVDPAKFRDNAAHA